MNKRNLIISFIFNLISFLLIAIFMPITLIDSTDAIKYFTNQSNIFCGLACGVMAIFELLVLIGKIKELPKWVSILKMSSCVGVILTFLVVAFYLNFVAMSLGYSYFKMYEGREFLYHFLVPVLAGISFIFFEKRKDISFKMTFLGAIHLLGYIIFYAINVLCHLQNGQAIRKYDWYYFATGEIWQMFPVGIAILIGGYGIGVGIWILNKKFIKE